MLLSYVSRRVVSTLIPSAFQVPAIPCSCIYGVTSAQMHPSGFVPLHSRYLAWFIFDARLRCPSLIDKGESTRCQRSPPPNAPRGTLVGALTEADLLHESAPHQPLSFKPNE
jgi:hypothetical protein